MLKSIIKLAKMQISKNNDSVWVVFRSFWFHCEGWLITGWAGIAVWTKTKKRDGKKPSRE